ncbi:MAG: lamin tail domain-containing protein [bacterium]|nr:lamin tail domain-containing protein [bacterium]
MYLKIGIFGLLFFPFLAFGEVRITEVMYDLSGADDGREWVELYNNGSEQVDLTGWKFFDGSNHLLNAPPKNGGTGTLVVPAFSYAILADDASVFTTEQHVAMSVIDTTMSLGQQKDKTYSVKLLDANGATTNEMSYTIGLGANGDGNSLQLISGAWKPASPTLGIANTNETNTPPPASTYSSTPLTSEQTSPAPNAGSIGAPSEPVPSLLVKISAPASITVGAEAVFSATIFGVKKEPIPNARVLWSFGNGAVKEGLSVRYGYNIPGSYMVVVDASSGGLAGNARMAVLARKPDVRVSGVLSGANGFVEIENRSNVDLDVSGWGLASGGVLFTIPDRTVILPSAKVAFPTEVTKLFVSENNARLLYPNGIVAAEYVVPPSPVNIPRPPKADTPLKGGFKESPLEGSAPSSASSADKEARGRDVSIATTAPAAISLSLANQTEKTIWLWLFGVAGVCLAGVGALAAFRFKSAQKDERSNAAIMADEINIV